MVYLVFVPQGDTKVAVFGYISGIIVLRWEWHTETNKVYINGMLVKRRSRMSKRIIKYTRMLVDNDFTNFTEDRMFLRKLLGGF